MDVLGLFGGLSLFLFGMSVMSSALEKRAGGGLKTLLSKLTSNRMIGFLTGLAVTAVIQSSSATTVMVVGFVNSGIMTLHQAISVIIGANVGTTATAWILSLTGITGDNPFLQMLKPTSFTPVLALLGIILYMSAKNSKRKDTGMILLGFATLMFGMEMMSDAVSGLRDVPEFQNLLLMFSNPILGILVGAVLTAIIQSSSASIGILQALSSTGKVTYGAAIPILMGMDIGTCITAILASVGTNRNARRAASVHLFFNVIGTIVWLGAFYILHFIVGFTFLDDAVNQFGIAVINTAFKLLSTVLLLPLSGMLERLAYRVIPDAKTEETVIELDERLLATPNIAISRCRSVAETMAFTAKDSLQSALGTLHNYSKETAEKIRAQENEADRYEDILGTYLVRVGTRSISNASSAESAKLLHLIGDLERISDHAVHILESAEEIQEKKIVFSPHAQHELSVVTAAVEEILELAYTAFTKDDIDAAEHVEPLEEVIDVLKEQLRSRHILRLQKGECSIEAGFVWSDLLTALERVADHCSNIAGCVVEMSRASLGIHGYLGEVKVSSQKYIDSYNEFARKYALEPIAE